jgi:hypothetical protein
LYIIPKNERHDCSFVPASQAGRKKEKESHIANVFQRLQNCYAFSRITPLFIANPIHSLNFLLTSVAVTKDRFIFN